jgi:PAS domain S-box-containing protein
MSIIKRAAAWLRMNPFRNYVVSIALALLPVSIFIFAAHKLLLNQVTAKLITQSTQSGRLIGTVLVKHLDDGRIILESFSTRPSLINQIEEKRFDEIAQHLEQLSKLQPDFESARVYGIDGTLKATYPAVPELIGKDHSSQDWYAGVTKDWKPYSSAIYRSDTGSQPWVVAIAVPINSRTGQRAGILVATQSLKSVTKDIYALTSESTTLISFVDQGGHAFGRRDKSVVVVETPQEIKDLISKNQTEASGGKIISIAGENFLVAYSPIRSIGWGIVLQLPVTALKKVLWDYEKNLVLLGLIIGLLALGGSAFVASLYKQLRDSENHTRLIVDRAHDAFIATDARGVINDWNAQAESTFGWTSTEIIGQDIEQSIFPRHAQELYREAIDGFKNAKKTREPGKRFETVALHKDGRPFPVELSIIPIPHGKSVTFSCFLRDISERNRAHDAILKLNFQLEAANAELQLRNREVERATQLKSQFLASMSHELRTPLNAIVGFSDLLAERIAGDLNEKQSRFVGHIKTGSAHLLQLINDILDLSKIESGQMDLHLEDFYVGDVLPEVLSTIRPLAMVKRIEVTQSIESVLTASADRVRFKQVLYNLLSNAIKFTPEGGKIRIEGWSDGDFSRIVVSDTGIGIRREDQELIFEEFRQASETTRGVKEGTGLGLAITRRLVQQHGGRLWVVSEQGNGSQFSFTIPKSVMNPGDPVVSATRHFAANPAKPQIMVVDDDPVARELLCSYLDGEGYTVVTAKSGQEALDSARVLRPDAITLDILMPNGSGFGTLYDLRNTPETATIPVVIVSVVDQRNLGIALGAADYLVKPVDRSLLLATISRHVKSQIDGCSDILIVDDDQQTRDLLSQCLQDAGYIPHVAENGKAALKVLCEIQPCAILLDLLMPEMDGFELLGELRRNEALIGVPVFVITSKDLNAQEIALLNKEAGAVFRKEGPWKEDLLRQIRKVLKNQSAARSASTA